MIAKVVFIYTNIIHNIINLFILSLSYLKNKELNFLT